MRRIRQKEVPQPLPARHRLELLDECRRDPRIAARAVRRHFVAVAALVRIDVRVHERLQTRFELADFRRVIEVHRAPPCLNQPSTASSAPAVRRQQHRQQSQTALIVDGLLLAERTEPVLAVIGAVAALADAAERLRFLREMREAPVHGHPARERTVQHAITVCRILAEPVQRERARAFVDVADRLFDTLVADDRKQRPEDLLARDRGPFARIEDERWRDLARRGIQLLARGIDLDDLGAGSPGVFDESGQPRVVPVADDARVVAIGGERRIELRHRALHRRGKFVDARPGHERVIGRDARLTGVEELADSDHRHDLREIAAGVDDDRRLAAELERHRRQVLRGGLRDHPPDRCRAGEEQVIERQLDERPARRGIAGKDGNLVVAERLGDDPRHELGRSRGHLRRLDHHAVAGCERRDRRQHRQLIRVVPRRDDADHAERLRNQPVVSRSILDIRRDALRTHPAPQMAARMADRFVDRQKIGDQRLVRRAAAEIRGGRVDDVLRMPPRHFRKTREPVRAHRVIRVCIAPRHGAHAFERVAHRRERGIVSSGVALIVACRRSVESIGSRLPGGRRHKGDDTLGAGPRRSVVNRRPA